MAEARLRHHWDLVAPVHLMLHNQNCTKETDLLKLSDVHPFYEPPPPIVLPNAGLLLQALFCPLPPPQMKKMP